MNVLRHVVSPFRRLFIDHDPEAWHDISRCQYAGQAGNDYVRNAIDEADGELCVAKFGTVELRNLLAFMADSHSVKHPQELWYYLRGYQELFPVDTFASLCHNAGFFPKDITLGSRWMRLVLDDVKEIDVLGSYQRAERRLEQELRHTVKIEIQSYLAPYLFEQPWTSALHGKRVLVVSPFTDTIVKQYARRESLFESPEVLPEFAELIPLRAVQSIAGTPTAYPDWFTALESMKQSMSSYDYDVALIGCGAYGMHLAAHAKRTGHIGIHTAGWTQMLFGIYGNRWLNDEPQFRRFINSSWVRPSNEERPAGADSIENACYW